LLRNYKIITGNNIAESSFYSKRTNFIRHLVLSCIDIEKENQRLKTTLREAQAQAAAVGQSRASEEPTWTGYFRGVKKDGNTIFPVWG
jgi:hypothetical protein